MNLLDENIHLASAFHLAGFDDVIATLREADDAAATEVPGAYYARLLEDDDGSDDQAARALHGAVQTFYEMRRPRGGRVADDVLAWAGFVHIGA